MAQTADTASQALIRQHQAAQARSDAINRTIQDNHNLYITHCKTIDTLMLLLITSIGGNLFLLYQLTH